jgi:uncharacterized membrane protein YphA (DoxX/SURF4 family)
MATKPSYHFGLSPPAPLAALTIALELGASLMILTGIYRWIGALALAAFTLMATLVDHRFWQMAPPGRLMAANGFFEHLGLVGGFLLVAWHDIRERNEQDPSFAALIRSSQTSE